MITIMNDTMRMEWNDIVNDKNHARMAWLNSVGPADDDLLCCRQWLMIMEL